MLPSCPLLPSDATSRPPIAPPLLSTPVSFTHERSRRRKLRETFACWRREAVASSRLRSRALSRISQATEGLVSEAFSVWRQGSAAARGKARALATLAGISNRRRSKRADMRLALRNWRRNACVDGGPTGDDDGGRGQDRGGDYGEVAGAGGLEAMAGVFVEATAAFSSASSVRPWGGGSRAAGGFDFGRVGGGWRSEGSTTTYSVGSCV